MKKLLLKLLPKFGILPIPMGEAADRYTILFLKWEKGRCENEPERKMYWNYCFRYLEMGEIDRLYEINRIIWSLESAIRQGKEGDLGLEEVGRRALEIRNFNNQRVAVKNVINDRTSWCLPEVKVDHASS